MNRYTKFSSKFYIKEDKKYDMSPLHMMKIPESSDDKFVAVTKQEQFNPDLIAKHYYNDETLYWYILMANSIFDPFSELYAGKVIRIPSKYYLDMLITLQ